MIQADFLRGLNYLQKCFCFSVPICFQFIISWIHVARAFVKPGETYTKNSVWLLVAQTSTHYNIPRLVLKRIIY